MNLEHFRAFVWLRWRLRANQFKKHGKVNAVLFVIMSVAAVVAATGLFIGFFAIGSFTLAHSAPSVLLYAWDAVVMVFLFIWFFGLVLELQRGEALSLDRLLHLPVSLTSAFLINYLSSLFNVTLFLALAAMSGLSIGLTVSRGLHMLWLFPLLAAFLMLVTAVTYQFQGWLATLMSNKRRRRTVIVVATMSLVLLGQLPNLANVFHLWGQPGSRSEQAELNKLALDHKEGRLSQSEYERRLNEEKDQMTARDQAIQQTVTTVNIALPPGWLPLGAFQAAEGSFVWPLLAIVGMAALGSLSLARAYRTTLRLYTGTLSSGRKAKPPPPQEIVVDPTAIGMLERQIPGVSERVSAIAMASLRSLLRAPEAKMMLLTPVILLVVFGSMLATRRTELPQLLRPLLGFGAMWMTMMSMHQILGNQFGFDRNGFRVYVLCPAQRRDVLFGKNLAAAPIAVGLMLVLITVLEAVNPMRLDLFLALLPQIVSVYLLYCILANWMSIIAPAQIAAGSLKAAKIRPLGIALQLASILVAGPVLGLTLLPLAAQALVEGFDLSAVPVCLLLSLVECGLVVLLYRATLSVEGDLLQAREQKILGVVTTRDE